VTVAMAVAVAITTAVAVALEMSRAAKVAFAACLSPGFDRNF
jgi:hypothetical protein